MSSEDSEYDETTQELIHYNIKDLAWESSKLTKRKKKLDKIHQKSQSPRSLKRSIKRVRDTTLSARTKPHNCPAWACDENETVVS